MTLSPASLLNRAVVPQRAAYTHADRDFLPTTLQECLLRAAFMDDASARTAWQRWRAQAPSLLRATDGASLDGASHRLLPLVYRRLDQLGMQDAKLPELREMYQHTWLKNHWMVRQAGQIIAALQSQNIPTLLLKGLPLALLYYGDLGTRPMDDFDVLVPTECAGQAITWLLANGWRMTTVRHRSPSQRYRASRHSFNFVNANGDGFDLHWFALHSCCYPGADEAWWKDAVPLQVDGVPTLTLRPEDMLLQVCAHAVVYASVAPVRWIADTLMILKVSQAGFEWDRVVAHAQHRRLTQPLAEMLTYLKQNFDVPVPDEILVKLNAEPVQWSDARIYEGFATNKPGLLQKAARHLYSYQRYVSMWRSATHTQPPINLLDFLLNQTSLQHPLQLIDLFWRKLNQTRA